jgi:soluble lytic murein transglycosylase
MKRRARKIVVLIVAFLLLSGIGLTKINYAATSGRTDADSDKSDLIERVVAYLKGRNVDMREDKLKKVVHSVYNESRQCDLDYRLALAVIQVESNFQQDVVSDKGARGLFQIKPSLAKYIAKDAGVKYNGDQCLHEPEKNIKLGIYHLSKLVDGFKNLPSALHAYNVGESRLRARSTKDIPKTAFTKKVMKEYQTNLSVLPDADSEK